jgi:hypothetical protein
MLVHIWCGSYAYDLPQMGIRDFCHWLENSEMLLALPLLRTHGPVMSLMTPLVHGPPMQVIAIGLLLIALLECSMHRPCTLGI